MTPAKEAAMISREPEDAELPVPKSAAGSAGTTISDPEIRLAPAQTKEDSDASDVSDALDVSVKPHRDTIQHILRGGIPLIGPPMRPGEEPVIQTIEESDQDDQQLENSQSDEESASVEELECDSEVEPEHFKETQKRINDGQGGIPMVNANLQSSVARSIEAAKSLPIAKHKDNII